MISHCNDGKKNCGFILIEIVLALFVIITGVVALTGLLGVSLETSAKAHSELHMTGFADMVFHYCHAAAWDSIPDSGTFSVQGYGSSKVPIQIGSLAQFSCLMPNLENIPVKAYTVSYILEVSTYEKIKILSLHIWPGVTSNGMPRVFHMEVYNWAKQ